MYSTDRNLKLHFSLCAIKERNRAGLTQEKAAELLLISDRCLQLIEAATRQPKFEVALRMANLYGLDLRIFQQDVILKPQNPIIFAGREDDGHISVLPR